MHKYLAREVEVQQPQLVVVLGDEIADKVHAMIQPYQIEPIYKPFPRTDNAGQFEDVRTRIAPYLKYVEVEQVTGDGAAPRMTPSKASLVSRLASSLNTRHSKPLSAVEICR